MRQPQNVGELVARNKRGKAIAIGVWQTYREDFDHRNGRHDVPIKRKRYITEDGSELMFYGGELQTADGELLTMDDPQALTLED